jgi:hypothetical protein
MQSTKSHWYPLTMEALGSATTIVQLISFTGEVLVLGYGYLSKVKKAASEIRALLREVAILNALLGQLQDIVIEQEDNESIKGALQTLESLGIFRDCETLVKLVEKGVKACEQISDEKLKNLGKKMVWPFKEKNIKDLMAQLGRLREALSAAMMVDSTKTLKNLEVIAKSIDRNLIESL